MLVFLVTLQNATIVLIYDFAEFLFKSRLMCRGFNYSAHFSTFSIHYYD
jgi:hypothetical protein